MAHYVYMIECSNGAYYTGYTTDLVRRYKEHKRGSAKCRYTRSFPPKRLLVSWKLNNKTDALRVESKIKKLQKNQKIQLIDMSVDTLCEFLIFDTQAVMTPITFKV